MSQWKTYSNGGLPLLFGTVPTESIRAIAGGWPGGGGGVVDTSSSGDMGDLEAVTHLQG
jgi:hypothetical protein